MITTEEIKTRLQECHEQENLLNKELSKIEYQIKQAIKKKKEIALKISRNMRYRNGLINRLSNPQEEINSEPSAQESDTKNDK